LRPKALFNDIDPSLYGAGSGAARAATTSMDDAARVLKSILNMMFAKDG